jgi:hypothetical protein
MPRGPSYPYIGPTRPELPDVERGLIRSTAEGRGRAKEPGQHMSRLRKLPPQQQNVRRRWTGGATLAELAKSYNVGRATISRLGESGRQLTEIARTYSVRASPK